MDGLSQPRLWVALIVAIIIGLAWQFIPLPDAKERMNQLPLTGPEYEGHDILLKPYEQEFLKGVNVVKRMYAIDNRKFFVTVLDGTHNRHVVHDPYYCFKGSGWEVVSENEIPIKNGHANLLVITKKKNKKKALFWFSDGKSQYTSPMRYWTQATLRRLTLGMSGPEPILIVVQPIHSEYISWEKFAAKFQPLFEL